MSTSTDCLLSGTLCSSPPFILSAGTVPQRPASRSISSHTAPLASPLRAAVSTRNLKAYASKTATQEKPPRAFNASGHLNGTGGRTQGAFFTLGILRQSSVYRLSGGIVLDVPMGHRPPEDGPHPLPALAAPSPVSLVQIGLSTSSTSASFDPVDGHVPYGRHRVPLQGLEPDSGMIVGPPPRTVHLQDQPWWTQRTSELVRPIHRSRMLGPCRQRWRT